MPLRYQIDDTNRLVLRPPRCLTDQEVFEYKQSVWSRARGGLRRADRHEGRQKLDVPTADRLRELARLSAAMDVGMPSKVAIVANDPITVEVARTYEVLRKLDRRSTRKVNVFLTVELAALWLRPPAKKRSHSGGIAT
jgi:hypothetical protein